jgi:hypothetical protein
VVLGAVVSISGTAHATPEILTLTPTSAQPDLLPGASTTGSLQILDQGSSSFNVRIYTAPYSVKGENYTPDFTPIPGSPNVANWIKTSASKGSIAAGQTLTVDYTLSVPAGTQPGGYYAVIFANEQLPKSAQGVVINEQVGEIFYITVAGPVKQAGKLLTWSSPFLQKPPISAVLRLENSGGLQYFSNVDITVSDIFGGPKYTLNTEKVILPLTIREIPMTWPHTPALGLFKVGGTATVLGKTVKLPTRYVLVVSSTVRRVLLIILIAIVLLIIVRFIVRKMRPKRKKSSRK